MQGLKAWLIDAHSGSVLTRIFGELRGTQHAEVKLHALRSLLIACGKVYACRLFALAQELFVPSTKSILLPNPWVGENWGLLPMC
ncbi:MAG: hypothetical protein JNJ65_00060 [Cyclobacteriaceae bacterium]|nr:hypothetical protein [Cyclobacteriaceae bacterium]